MLRHATIPRREALCFAPCTTHLTFPIPPTSSRSATSLRSCRLTSIWFGPNKFGLFQLKSFGLLQGVSKAPQSETEVAGGRFLEAFYGLIRKKHFHNADYSIDNDGINVLR